MKAQTHVQDASELQAELAYQAFEMAMEAICRAASSGATFGEIRGLFARLFPALHKSAQQ